MRSPHQTALLAALCSALSLCLLTCSDDPTEPADGDADSDIDGDSDADANVDADADADADANADADSDADSDTDSDMDGLSDADKDIEADIEVDVEADAELDPDRLHQDIEHLTDGALIDALLDRVEGHTSVGYDDARIAIFTDIDVDVHSGMIECVYTGVTTSEDGTHTPGTFNTEHSWPRADGADTEPAESDLHHLFPTNSDANNRRGSYPFGDTDCSDTGSCDWSMGGSELGDVTGGATRVFEVRSLYRGDIARAHFYFSVRYDLSIPNDEEEFLRAWHDEDPPSAVEESRNDAIEGYQDNRNPFIDRPDFVDQIADF